MPGGARPRNWQKGVNQTPANKRVDISVRRVGRNSPAERAFLPSRTMPDCEPGPARGFALALHVSLRSVSRIIIFHRSRIRLRSNNALGQARSPAIEPNLKSVRLAGLFRRPTRAGFLRKISSSGWRRIRSCRRSGPLEMYFRRFPPKDGEDRASAVERIFAT